jgi:hypothetical protein
MTRTGQLFEKIAQVRPDVFEYIQETQDEVRKSPFRDEIVGRIDGILKTAGFGEMAGKAALGAGLAVGAGIAHSLAGDIYDSLKRGITKGRNYQAMMSANRDLGEHPAEKVHQVFGTLHTFNPEFAGDPHVAGSFVRQQLTLAGEHGQVDLHSLTNLVAARKNITDTRKLPSMKISDR